MFIAMSKGLIDGASKMSDLMTDFAFDWSGGTVGCLLLGNLTSSPPSSLLGSLAVVKACYGMKEN
jgi:hypothetical protein